MVISSLDGRAQSHDDGAFDLRRGRVGMADLRRNRPPRLTRWTRGMPSSAIEASTTWATTEPKLSTRAMPRPTPGASARPSLPCPPPFRARGDGASLASAGRACIRTVSRPAALRQLVDEELGVEAVLRMGDAAPASGPHMMRSWRRTRSTGWRSRRESESPRFSPGLSMKSCVQAIGLPFGFEGRPDAARQSRSIGAL